MIPQDDKGMDKDEFRKRLTKLGFSMKTIPVPDFEEGIREVRRGRIDIGMSLLKKWTQEWKGGAPHALLCQALIMIGKYDEAIGGTTEALVKYNSDTFYAQRGICYWLKGEYDLAGAAWEDGALHSQYRDAAGGLELPLLIYGTSLIRSHSPELYKNRLLMAYEGCRKMYWPSPLVRYVLGKEDISHPQEAIAELEKLSIQKNPELPSQQRHSTKLRAILSFYSAIVALQNNNLQEFRDAIHDCASYQECEGYAEWWIAHDMVNKGMYLHGHIPSILL